MHESFHIYRLFSWLQNMSLEAFVPLIGTSRIPQNISTAVRNNAGGAYNHLLFFKVCSAQAAHASAAISMLCKCPFEIKRARSFNDAFSILARSGGLSEH